ncbi:MAG: hypothetical protein V4437_01790 [Patescibacteria group bacterium]
MGNERQPKNEGRLGALLSRLNPSKLLKALFVDEEGKTHLSNPILRYKWWGEILLEKTASRILGRTTESTKKRRWNVAQKIKKEREEALKKSKRF